MSADNTILILELKDQFRVAHIQGMDNIYWQNGEEKETPVSLRIFELFHDIKPIIGNWLTLDSRRRAFEEAGDLYCDVGYVEYGIQILYVAKTWKEIVLEAKLQVDEETSYVYNNPRYLGGTESYILEELEKIKNEINDCLAINIK